ncbi:MAG: DedA family protein [Candidatus Aenigmatarchaeota archaeon]
MFENVIIEVLREKVFLGIFLGTILEYILPPIPSEMVLPIGGYLISFYRLGTFGLIYGIFFATIGTTIGSIFYYLLSLYFGRKFIEKYGKKILIDKKKIEVAEKWFKRYGKLAVLIGRMIPGIRELISIPAGLLKMNLAEYIFYTFIGSFVWSSLLISLGYIFGEMSIPIIQKLFTLIVLVVFLSFISYIIFRKIITRFIKKK